MRSDNNPMVRVSTAHGCPFFNIELFLLIFAGCYSTLIPLSVGEAGQIPSVRLGCGVIRAFDLRAG